MMGRSLLPLLFAIPFTLYGAIALPLTQRFFLPPPETITRLIAYSRNQPAPAEPVLYDVEYHSDLLRRYRLDIYGPLDGSAASPADASPADDSPTGNAPPDVSAAFRAAAPVIVFYHGGSWLRGDKITIRVIDRFLRRMRSRGWYVVSVNYTTSLLRGIGGPVGLARSAYGWVVENADLYGWDSSRIGLYGISSGGHVALMTAASPGKEFSSLPNGFTDSSRTRPAFVLAECAPTDLVAMREGDAFENSGSFRLFPRRRLKKLSPIQRVSPHMPPVLLYHGDADRTVDVDQSIRYAAALNDAGGDAELHIWPGGDHAFLNYSDAQWDEQEQIALRWMEERFR